VALADTIAEAMAFAARSRDEIGFLVEEGRPLEVRCSMCHSHRLIAPADAVARFGQTTRISDVRKRARCARCGATNEASASTISVGIQLPTFG